MGADSTTAVESLVPSLWRRAAIEAAHYAVALTTALILIGLMLLGIGANPLVAYGTILQSSLGTLGGFGQTLNKATPLILGALAVALALRGGFLNVGVDGQIYLGAIFATGAAFLAGNTLPVPITVLVVLAAGMLGGMVAALPAALLRAYWSVNEIFITVMLNFIFTYLADYFATGPWNDPLAGEAITRPIGAAAHLPMLIAKTGTHSGILVALVVTGAVAWLLNRTVLGYSVRAVGDNPAAARVGGITISTVALVTLCLSGAIAGLAGSIEVSGYHQRLILGLSPGYGYMAILLAVLGKQRPLGVVVAGFAFAVLLTGSDSLQRSARLPQSAVLVFQAVILLSILFAEAVRSSGADRQLREYWKRRAP